MQVSFTPEEEAQLSQIAIDTGTDPERLVKDAALRLLHEDVHIREGVRRGIIAAERGDFIDHADVWAGVEKILQT